MATVETRNARDTTFPQREEKQFTEGLGAPEEASEKSVQASEAPSWMSATGIASPLQEEIFREGGRFTLAEGTQGFYWILTSKSGSVWYWHPEGRRWIANCRDSCTEEPTAGLDENLAHEQARDLDEGNALAKSMPSARAPARASG
jgi:hypothetical protein